MTSDIAFEDLMKLMRAYEAQTKQDLRSITDAWPADLSEHPIPRVLGALIARQTTLALHVVSDPFFWNADIGPLILRPMLENWLKIEWCLKAPLARCLGIAKADLSGAKSRVQRLAATTRYPGAQQGGTAILELLDQEESLFLAEGKPVMIDSRQMAKNVGGEALIAYRRHHVLMSSCVHSAWNHIARYNLKVNPNPLHRHNFVPMLKEPDIDAGFALTAAEYCDKAFRSILRSNGSLTTAYDDLLNKLHELGVVCSIAPDEADRTTDDE